MLGLALGAMAQGFRYVPVNYFTPKRVMVNLGGVNNLGQPKAFISSLFDVSGPIDPTSVTGHFRPVVNLFFTSTDGREEAFQFGNEIGFQYSQMYWETDYEGSLFGDKNYDYHIGKKSHDFMFQMGVNFSVVPADRFEINMGVGLSAELHFGNKGMIEAIRKSNGQPYDDPDNQNEWHKFGSDVPFNADFSVYGRLGVNYQLNDFIFAGLSAQYKYPFVSTAMDELDAYGVDPVGYNIVVLDGRQPRLYAMLTLGFYLK